jgi:hypothetical protein
VGITSGIQSISSNQMPTTSISAGSAAPASGKYGGFGSEDIAKLGYGKEGQFNQPYDPYTKAQSATSTNTHQLNNNSSSLKPTAKATEEKKDKNKKKKKDDSDSDSSDSSDDSSEDEKANKTDKNQKAPEVVKEEPKKSVGIQEAPKATRTIGGVTIIGNDVNFKESGREPRVEVATKIEPEKPKDSAQSILDLLSAPSSNQSQSLPQQNTAFTFMQPQA